MMRIQKLKLEQEYLLSSKAKMIRDLLDIEVKVDFESHYFLLELALYSFGTRIGEAHYRVLATKQFICESCNIPNPHNHLVAFERNVRGAIEKLEHFVPVICEILFNDYEDLSDELPFSLQYLLDKQISEYKPHDKEDR